MIDEDMFAEGIMFDGSSIAGWKAINESDMMLMPDPTTAQMDPFFSAATMSIVCDILEPSTGEPYNRDPRGIAKKAEAYMKSTGIGDTDLFRPRGRVLHLRRREVLADPLQYRASSSTRRSCRPTATPTTRAAISATASGIKGGYFPVPPLDRAQDMRGEMLAAMADDGRDGREAPPRGGLGAARTRHEVRHRWSTMADHMQIYKYCIHNVAHSYGKTATFMPKPVYGDNGSGMHVPPVDLEGRQAAVRRQPVCGSVQECLYYIGGIIKHAKALNAFTNPSTNSYKRLVPGFEAPVLLAYSARNRSASCRIPWTTSPEGEARRGALPRSAAPIPISPLPRC